MKMICPNAKNCPCEYDNQHCAEHDKNEHCGEVDNGDGDICPACVPVKAKRKGKK